MALLSKGGSAQEKAAHEQIKDYYLSIAGPSAPQFPTLDDLKPLIEVVHHACEAGAYDEAWKIYWERIQQQKRFLLNKTLGADETDVGLLFGFFPDGEVSEEPRISLARNKPWILNEIGLCLMNLGRLREAVPFCGRAVAGYLDGKDWLNASTGYHVLAYIHAYIGALEASAAAAASMLDLAHRAKDKNNECFSTASQGWVEHLRGNLEAAQVAFVQAEKLAQETSVQSNIRYLYAGSGTFHATYLRRIGNLDYARRVTEANLKISERNHWPQSVSQSHRILGDLDADAGQHKSARAHYDTALKIARNVSSRCAH